MDLEKITQDIRADIDSINTWDKLGDYDLIKVFAQRLVLDIKSLKKALK